MIDPYCYPNSNVLMNKYNIQDANLLFDMERDFTNLRLATVHKIHGKFDANHMKAIHYHLFQDVYDWAGEFRTGDIWKDGSSFTPYAEIHNQLMQFHSVVKSQRFMKRSFFDKYDVAMRLESDFAMLDKIHPFREGNGRTERVVLGMLANNAGYYLDFSHINRDDWVQASKLALYGTHDVMTDILAEALHRNENTGFFSRKLPFVNVDSFRQEQLEYEKE